MAAGIRTEGAAVGRVCGAFGIGPRIDPEIDPEGEACGLFAGTGEVCGAGVGAESGAASEPFAILRIYRWPEKLADSSLLGMFVHQQHVVTLDWGKWRSQTG
jgi:hypothetical protein